MKALSVLSLATASLALATPVEKSAPLGKLGALRQERNMDCRLTHSIARRQFDLSSILSGLGLMSGFSRGDGTPAKVEKLTPMMRKDAFRERMWFGPFTLPAVDV